MRKYNLFLKQSDPEIELSQDLCMRNVIQTCLDYAKPQSMADKANILLDMIFSQNETAHYRHMLIGLFEQVIALDFSLQSYSKFFISHDQNDIQTTTFAQQHGLPSWTY